MEFWGVEVKAGEPLAVTPVPGMVIHLSQACLGETKSKGNDSALLNVRVGDKKLVLGLLSPEKYPQLTFDLVFEKQFELSHNWRSGSIHFCGYQTTIGGDEEDDDEYGDYGSEEESEEEDIPSLVDQNGTSDKKLEQANSAVAKAKAAAKPDSEKPKVKIAEPKKEDDDEDSDDDEDDSSDDEEGSDDDSDEAMLDGEDSDDDDSEDESDEETPKKPEVSKKRVNETAAKTPVPAKKPKSDASPKSDGKKVGGHTATPYPTKKGGKPQASTPAATDKPRQQTPKSGGVSCKSCSKTFGSDKALESHTKAKHA